MSENTENKPGIDKRSIALNLFILIMALAIMVTYDPYTGTLSVASFCSLIGLFALLIWKRTSSYPPKLINPFTLIYAVFTACLVLFTGSVLFGELISQLDNLKK